ncbi:flagellar hook-basal body complex protein [Sulfurimonas sp. NW15]|uniref:flagellar hook protein FlgE n=1 Tax=Sulfurimonas sp. NW15 TaxID=2922729 RepID=UPI003DAA2D98
MMTQAFYTGISGLKNNSAGIDVVSNNLANIDTIGFRGYDLEFSSLFESSIATSFSDSDTIGKGVQVQASGMVQSQGPLALSDRSTDLAIEGDGWFGVSDGEKTIYTRDGAFSIDANADLVTADGFHVLGTLSGNISDDNVLTNQLDEVKLGDVGQQQQLRFPKTLTYPPEATTNAKFLANLGVGFDPVSVGASVIDSQGNRNNLRLEFVKDPLQTPPGSQYNVTATVKSLDGNILYDTQTGKVEFDAAGALRSSTLTSIDNNGTTVTIDMGTGYDGITSVNTPVMSGSSITDGIMGGDLEGYSINKNAEVIATFTNGKQSSVGKIAIYHFTNDQGLTRLNGSRFEESANSGQATFFTDENGQNIIGAQVRNFTLESSNIEMSYGLTELIILQRAYDANSKSITTADQMMQKALNMDA